MVIFDIGCYKYFGNFYRFIFLPFTAWAITASNWHRWKHSGYLTTQTLRYQAYLFLLCINLIFWILPFSEAIFGCNLSLANTVISTLLILALLVLGLTNYIPRHPPFSLRRKIFVIATFAILLMLIISPIPTFIPHPVHKLLIFISWVLWIHSTIRYRWTQWCAGCEERKRALERCGECDCCKNICTIDTR